MREERRSITFTAFIPPALARTHGTAHERGVSFNFFLFFIFFSGWNIGIRIGIAWDTIVTLHLHLHSLRLVSYSCVTVGKEEGWVGLNQRNPRKRRGKGYN